MNAVDGWLVGRLPDDWFEGEPEVTVDREEILVVGRLPKPVQSAGAKAATTEQAAEQTAGRQASADADDASPRPADAGDDSSARAAEAGRIKRFREDTRAQRMKIADETEARFGRKVAWGAVCGETRTVFTNMSIPVMTRLRQPERMVLDTLVEAGVARTRSEALAWCVRPVGTHEADWIEKLREALGVIREARESGPAA